MGNRNVSAAWLTANRMQLTVTESYVLTVMAMTAHDDDTVYARTGEARPRRIYFAGWQYLAEQLPGVDAQAPNARRYVLRLLQSLRDKGVIEVVEHGHRGRNARYKLVIGLESGEERQLHAVS